MSCNNCNKIQNFNYYANYNTCRSCTPITRPRGYGIGPQGPEGPQGPTGPTGISQTGPQGINVVGSTGPTGPDGPDGPTGPIANIYSNNFFSLNTLYAGANINPSPINIGGTNYYPLPLGSTNNTLFSNVIYTVDPSTTYVIYNILNGGLWSISTVIEPYNTPFIIYSFSYIIYTDSLPYTVAFSANPTRGIYDSNLTAILNLPDNCNLIVTTGVSLGGNYLTIANISGYRLA